MKILAQCPTASPCERNWSSYDYIYSKKRNRLTSARCRKLVYVFQNARFSARYKNTCRVAAYRARYDPESDSDAESIEEIGAQPVINVPQVHGSDDDDDDDVVPENPDDPMAKYMY